MTHPQWRRFVDGIWWEYSYQWSPTPLMCSYKCLCFDCFDWRFFPQKRQLYYQIRFKSTKKWVIYFLEPTPSCLIAWIRFFYHLFHVNDFVAEILNFVVKLIKVNIDIREEFFHRPFMIDDLICHRFGRTFDFLCTIRANSHQLFLF